MKVWRDVELFNFVPHHEQPTRGQMDDFTYETKGFGTATPWKPTGQSRRKFSLSFYLSGLSIIGDFRRFVDRQRGRMIPFWVPTFANDFPIVYDGIACGVTSITVQGSEFQTYYAAGAQAKFIALVTRSGKLECYGVTAVAASGSNTVLTLDRELDSALTASETICCPLLLCRFSDDSIDLTYESGDTISAIVGFTELPKEYPVPASTGSVLSTGVFGSRPVFLYQLSGGGATYYYADYGVDVVANGHTWIAADVEHGPLKSASDLLGDEVEVSFYTDDTAHPLAAYLSEFSMMVYTLTIYQADVRNLAAFTGSSPWHLGRIEKVQIGEAGQYQCTVSSIFRMAQRQVPTEKVQRTCNWRTYDGIGCQADEATFTTAGTITAVSAADPPYVEAAEFGAKATAEGDANWFALGKVTAASEIRICTGQSGNRLYLNFAFENASIGNAISAVAGDDKRITTCNTKFNQLLNHSGSPYTPNENPQMNNLDQPTPSGGKKG
jgi:Phage conserved hypothetical protein BR0599